MQKLMSYMRCAMERYNMIEENDVIAVCVSGGKDSLALLCAMSELKRFYPKKFSIIALTLDPCFNNNPADYSEISELCKRLDVPYIIKRTDFWHVIFEVRLEKNPCSLCARMRRGLLHDTAKEYGANKLALGHHMDDAVETFYMNLLNGGQISCFSPISYLSRKDIHMIRPMIFATENDIIRVINKLELPVLESECSVDGKTERENIKQKIALLEKDYTALRQKTLGALQRGNISGW